ncbi:hypothetical protein [Burkholderia stagnalis]|uniref:Uncharacterized protein n=1 Tax=Burkholderia stagnalis TaxID=1503054 RepID=A0A6L3N258_9BURK|nr:hypothetical protein [Burkholderia stagnalis]KAB0639814.1 hypothetical protein F7R25_07635 [Burkholderia stagnalis]
MKKPRQTARGTLYYGLPAKNLSLSLLFCVIHVNFRVHQPPVTPATIRASAEIDQATSSLYISGQLTA